jgi:hypothetical protein
VKMKWIGACSPSSAAASHAEMTTGFASLPR